MFNMMHDVDTDLLGYPHATHFVTNPASPTYHNDRTDPRNPNYSGLPDCLSNFTKKILEDLLPLPPIG